MKAIKIFMIMALSSALAGCSDWLSEDGAPKLTYDTTKRRRSGCRRRICLQLFALGMWR